MKRSAPVVSWGIEFFGKWCAYLAIIVGTLQVIEYAGWMPTLNRWVLAYQGWLWDVWAYAQNLLKG